MPDIKNSSDTVGSIESLSPPPKVILLDLGGVVRFDLWETAFESLATDHSLDRSWVYSIGQKAWRLVDTRKYGTADAIEDEWAEACLFELPRKITAEELKFRIREAVAFIDEKVTVSMLNRLSSKGIRLAIATNDNKPWFEYCRDKLKYDLWFRREDTFTSFNFEITKKNPDFFARCIEELKVKPADVLFCDDRLENCLVASKIGLGAILVPPGQHGPTYLDRLLAYLGL